MQTPLILITLSYLLGLLLGHAFLYAPITIILAAFGAIVAAVILVKRGNLPLTRLLLIMVPALIGAMAYVLSMTWMPADHYLRTLAFDRKDHNVLGTVTTPLDRDPGRTAFLLDVREIDGRRVSGRVRVSVRDELADIGYNDLLRMEGRIFEPGGYQNPGGFDYPEYLAQRGVRAMLSVKQQQNITVIKQGNGLFRTIQDWRERIRQAFLAATDGPGSAILQAMVLGEEGMLTDEMRDRFMAAGVTHIISISGSHLGLVAVLCFGFVRLILFALPERSYHRLTIYADPKKIAAWLTVLPVTFYALLAGGQVATMRSLAMILAALTALVLDREHGLMRSLAAAALGLLILWPQALFDISFQLSYLSVLTIGYVVTFWNELQLPAATSLQKMRNGTALLTVISLATGLATGPLVAFHFNQVSLIGVASNILIVPFAGFIVVPLGLLSGVLSLFFGSLPLAALNQIVADAFVNAVNLFSRVPFAEARPPAPNLVWLIAYALLIVSSAAFFRARLLYRARPLEYSARSSRLQMAGMFTSAAILALAIIWSFITPQRTRLTVLDVGQGDCSLLELSSGETILIDGGGTYDNRFDMGRRVVAPFLWNRGIRKLDLVILSHPHPDHVNGLFFTINRFRVGEIWERGWEVSNPAFDEFRQLARQREIPMLTTPAGTADRVGSAVLRVLHPAPTYRPNLRKAYAVENNRSLVVMADTGQARFLFTGDCEADAEAALLSGRIDLACDVLKVPHHGSKSSSTAEFVSAARPAIAVASAGRTNRFGHPAEEVITRYEQQGTRFFRTDRDGAVIVIAAADGIKVHSWADLMLQRITLDKGSTWWKLEKENWRRIYIRMSTRSLT